MNLDCGRMGNLYGVFVADPSKVEALMGKTIYFGEVLGKHSDIEWDLDPKDIVPLTNDQEFIAKAKEYGIVPTGHNPIDYYEEQQRDQ